MCTITYNKFHLNTITKLNLSNLVACLGKYFLWFLLYLLEDERNEYLLKWQGSQWKALKKSKKHTFVKRKTGNANPSFYLKHASVNFFPPHTWERPHNDAQGSADCQIWTNTNWAFKAKYSPDQILCQNFCCLPHCIRKSEAFRCLKLMCIQVLYAQKVNIHRIWVERINMGQLNWIK